MDTLGTLREGSPETGSSGSSGYDTAALAKNIQASLDQHPGFAVRSVRCPPDAKQAKGVVIRCSATLRDGEVDQMRATQTDDNGTIHLVGSLIFADNVERAVKAYAPAAGASAIYTVTRKGSITFKPVGCTYYEFSPHAVRVLHDCL